MDIFFEDVDIKHHRRVAKPYIPETKIAPEKGSLEKEKQLEVIQLKAGVFFLIAFVHDVNHRFPSPICSSNIKDLFPTIKTKQNEQI